MSNWTKSEMFFAEQRAFQFGALRTLQVGGKHLPYPLPDGRVGVGHPTALGGILILVDCPGMKEAQEMVNQLNKDDVWKSKR